MNKDVDRRYLPQGEYMDANNAVVINGAEQTDGVLKTSLSNKRLTNIDFGANPVEFGAMAYHKRNRIYWAVKSDSGCFLMEYDQQTQVVSFVLKDTRMPGSRVFDLRDGYYINDMHIISSDDESKELLLLTDNNMQPLCINIARAKTYAENGFDKEDIFLIKNRQDLRLKQTLYLPVGLKTKWKNCFSFCYRYKYLDGEYSALSPFTNYKFSPNRTTWITTPQTM
jgi:hypothetical protein